jgi:hypothetical protein
VNVNPLHPLPAQAETCHHDEGLPFWSDAFLHPVLSQNRLISLILKGDYLSRPRLSRPQKGVRLCDSSGIDVASGGYITASKPSTGDGLHSAIYSFLLVVSINQSIP